MLFIEQAECTGVGSGLSKYFLHLLNDFWILVGDILSFCHVVRQVVELDLSIGVLEHASLYRLKVPFANGLFPALCCKFPIKVVVLPLFLSQ